MITRTLRLVAASTLVQTKKILYSNTSFYRKPDGRPRVQQSERITTAMYRSCDAYNIVTIVRRIRRCRCSSAWVEYFRKWREKKHQTKTAEKRTRERRAPLQRRRHHSTGADHGPTLLELRRTVARGHRRTRRRFSRDAPTGDDVHAVLLALTLFFFFFFGFPRGLGVIVTITRRDSIRYESPISCRYLVKLCLKKRSA